MHYSLAHTFGQYRAGRLDPDAKAYIAAVVATGVTVTSTQRTAVDTFYKTAKDDGYYTSLKRLYLPIWGAAAANAIDMITLTSGTFGGGVTHGAGFVQGNGTTGYFQSDISANTAGRSLSSGHDFVVVLSAPTGVATQWFCGGTSNSFARRCGILSIPLNTEAYSNTIATAALASPSIARALHSGVLLGSRTANNAFSFYGRKTAGFSTLRTISTTETVDAPTTRWCYMARAEDSDVVRSSFCNAQIAASGFGLGLTLQQSTDYSLALKNLWETATGLTLP